MDEMIVFLLVIAIGLIFWGIVFWVHVAMFWWIGARIWKRWR